MHRSIPNICSHCTWDIQAVSPSVLPFYLLLFALLSLWNQVYRVGVVWMLRCRILKIKIFKLARRCFNYASNGDREDCFGALRLMWFIQDKGFFQTFIELSIYMLSDWRLCLCGKRKALQTSACSLEITQIFFFPLWRKPATYCSSALMTSNANIES